jgi:hypothetical protein
VQLGVAHDELVLRDTVALILRRVALEVHADGPPVSDDVIDEKPRWAEVVAVTLEIPLERSVLDAPVYISPRRRHRLEQEKHPTQIAGGQRSPDMPGQGQGSHRDLPANEDVAHVGDEALGGRRGERRRRL